MFKNENEKSGVTVKSTKSGFTVKASVKSEDVQMVMIGTSTVALISAVGPTAAGLAADGIRGGFRLASKGLKAAKQAAKAAVEKQKVKAAEKKAAKQAAKAAEAEKQKEADQ
jgi:hypothetical protein